MQYFCPESKQWNGTMLIFLNYLTKYLWNKNHKSEHRVEELCVEEIYIIVHIVNEIEYSRNLKLVHTFIYAISKKIQPIVQVEQKWKF